MTNTKLPWEMLPAARSSLIHIESSDGHNPVCSIPKARALDAAFIIRACNAHDDLVAVLERLRKDYHSGRVIDINGIDGGRIMFADTWEQVEAALAKAKG